MRRVPILPIFVSVLVSGFLVSGACAKARTPPPAKHAVTADAGGARVAGPVKAATKIVWHHDDYGAALAVAKQQQVPLVIDMWAPWCHSCLSMTNYVITDANFGVRAAQFVWLALDTEKAQNAAAQAKFGVDAWPTYYVVDPADESVAGRWIGAASPADFGRFLDEGARAVETAHAGTLPAGSPLALLLTGHRELAARRFTEAAALFAQALAAAPASWPRRPEALVARMSALSRAKDYAACADLGLASMGQTGRATSAADFAATALMCAEALPKDDPRVVAMRTAVAARMTEIADDPDGVLAADDKSGVYALLREARELQGDTAGAKAAAQQQIAVLEQASAGVPDDVATTYDGERADVLLYLGRGEDAIAFLKQREAGLPEDYNPPHRLARVYRTLKRYDEALAAMARALPRAYGPRKAGILGEQAGIYEDQGKKAEAAASVRAQLEVYRALPASQVNPERVQAAEARLARLEARQQ